MGNLKSKNQKISHELSHLLIEFETEWENDKKKLKILQENLAIYEQILGLTLLHKKQGELLILMNNIDPHATDRIFMFAIRIGKHKLYHVNKISPMVSGWEHDLAALNANPETFYVLVRKFRNRFQNLISSKH